MRVILLPGLDGTGDLFQEFVRATPAGFEAQVVAYPKSEALTYPQYREFVKTLLPEKGPSLVLGESFSGPVAISVAVHSPSGMKGLILCNTFACSPAWSSFRFFPWRLVFSFPMPRYLIGSYLVGFRDVKPWVDPIRRANAKVQPRVLAARMREVLSVDVRPELSSLSLPVLYIRGAKDRLVRDRSLNQIVKAKPDVSVAVLDAPHLSLQLAPEEAWAAISEFVNERCLS